jgi:two-component system sensor histidine kinase RpfC
MVHTVKTSGSALLSLIDDILDLSRIEANKVAVVLADLDLHAELADLAAMLRPQAVAKGLHLDVSVAADVPFRLRGDGRHLRQVLTNLVANAVKFTATGFVHIGVTRLARPRADSILLRFDVEDTGIGIPPEQHKRIFERFTQADDQVNRRFGGTGLGLAISKSLVSLLGGSISIRSTPGQGSTFSVEVPFAPQSDDAAAAVSLPDVVVAISSDPTLIQRLRSALSELRVAAISASDVAEAGTLLSRRGHPAQPVHVAIVDCRERPVSGAELASLRVRSGAGANAQAIRIVSEETAPDHENAYVTSLNDAPDRQRLINALHVARAFAGRASGDAESAPAVAGQAVQRRALDILVVEDNPVNQKVTRRILEHAGHAVAVAGSGEDALEALEDGEFDLMVVDVNMPGISGIDIVKLHRMANLDKPRMPILALSADATPETRKACEDAGVDAYLTKPVEARRLLDVIDGLALADDKASVNDRSMPAAQSVTSIATHPRFRSETYPAVNWGMVGGLAEFGGDEFVFETMRDYVVNTEGLLEEIAAAVNTVNADRFRDRVHALRGTSGNVGAEALWRSCQDMRGMTGDRLRSDGEHYLQQLQREFSRFQREIARFATAQHKTIS